MKRSILLSCFLGLLLLAGSAEASHNGRLVDGDYSRKKGYVVKDGKLVDRRDVATMSVQEHYGAGMEALQKEEWKEAAAQFRIITSSFPDTPFGKEASYYLGVSYARSGAYEKANDYLSLYLEEQPNGQHFEHCLEYKLHVADAFRNGEKRHLFGIDKLPKWLPGDKTALEIYDEIVELAPGHELAAKSLYSKALFLTTMRRYPEAVDAAQLLIHRFPKHEMVPEAYLAISEVYYKHCCEQHNNPDLLPLANINLRRFQNHLPREERFVVAEENIQKMREVCAGGLLATAQFYERTKHERASVLYYVRALQKFPETKVAQQCKKRLHALEEVALELKFSKELWL